MKFSDGYWLMRKGVSCYSPMTLRDCRREGNSLVVYAPTKNILNRGDTLNRAQITIEYSSPLPNVIRVRMAHFLGGLDKGPHFALEEGADSTPEIHCSPGEPVRFRSGDLELEIPYGADWNARFRFKGKDLTGSPLKGAGYLTEETGAAYFREQLDLDVGEAVYGLGERFTPFVKNGQTVDIWNEDGGTSSEQSYKNIPFYLSSKGYGILVNHPEKVSFEVASEVVSRVQFSVPGEVLEYFVIAGDGMKDVLSLYTRLSGRPALPPAWSFGLWLTTSFTTSYDEETVNSFIDGMAERDIPLQVFHYDCFWMKEFQWCDFEWDRDVFPDPEGMLARQKEKGLKTCLWINPYIAQKSALFREGQEKGYLLKKTDGSVWQWDMWQAGMGLVDFTNPAAAEWYKGKLSSLLRQGADVFKTDFGERIPVEEVAYFDGSDPYKMHNYYTFLYNKAVFEVLQEEKGKGEALLFARSATVGGQQFPVHWGGDCSASYPSMAESLRGGLSLCLSGFGFWSHDIGGFEQTASPDLYKRWSAFGLLSTHSRLHGSESYRVPWNFDEEAVDVLRFFTRLKNRLMPYLYNEACRTAETGIPMMRAMVLEFPDDPACAYLDTQYMLGGSLLVAPIFNEQGKARYYLPEGLWLNFLDSSVRTGGRWHTEHHSYMSLPLMMRTGHIVAMNPRDDAVVYDYCDGVVFHLFRPENGTFAVVRNSKGEAELTIAVGKEGNRVEIRAEGRTENWKIRIQGDTVESCSLPIDESSEGSALIDCSGANHLELSLREEN